MQQYSSNGLYPLVMQQAEASQSFRSAALYMAKTFGSMLEHSRVHTCNTSSLVTYWYLVDVKKLAGTYNTSAYEYQVPGIIYTRSTRKVTRVQHEQQQNRKAVQQGSNIAQEPRHRSSSNISSIRAISWIPAGPAKGCTPGYRGSRRANC